MTHLQQQEIKHLVTNIQRFSVNDGPGIRTTVFLKGCPLNCAWCHNPENIPLYQQFFHYEEKCQKCGACAEVCPEQAIIPPRIRYKENLSDFINNGADGSVPVNLEQAPKVDTSPPKKEVAEIELPRIDRDKCTRCMKCVDACAYEALKPVSTMRDLEDIFAEVMKDQLFYESSGGGFTVSGGEPLMHPEMTVALFKKAKENNIHTVLDTCGMVPWKNFERALPFVDLILFDIKVLDEAKHKKWTGSSNRLILENFKKLAAVTSNIRVRMPIIHSVNFWDLQYPRDIVAFAKPYEKSILGIDILPFHSFMAKKLGNLGQKGYFDSFPNIFKEEVEDYKTIISEGGSWQTTVGGLIGVQENEK